MVVKFDSSFHAMMVLLQKNALHNVGTECIGRAGTLALASRDGNKTPISQDIVYHYTIRL